MKLDDSVVSHFTSSLDRYTSTILPKTDKLMEIFEPFAEKQMKVLELGCGTGHRLEGLSTYYPRFDLFGVDITPAMVKTARSIRPENIIFTLGDCLYSSFAAQTFDAIIMYDVLHHLVTGQKDESSVLREAGLKEVVRLMKPNGFIVLKEVCVNTQWRSAVIFYISYLLSKMHISIPALNIHTDVVVNFFALDELEDTLTRFNLKIVKRDLWRSKALGTWISTLGSYTYQATYFLEKDG